MIQGQLCKLFISEKNEHIMVGTEIIKRTSCEKLLRLTVAEKLTFEDHVSNLCRKLRQENKS